jgi:hypothetical protein
MMTNVKNEAMECLVFIMRRKDLAVHLSVWHVGCRAAHQGPRS